MADQTSTPDAEAVNEFLRRVHGEGPHRLIAFGDGRPRGILTDDPAAFINGGGADYYFQPAIVRDGFAGTKTSKADITGSRWAWIDFDPPSQIKSDPKKLSLWRSTAPDALLQLQPTLLIDSGRGFWAFFELTRTVEPERLERINRGLLRKIDGGDDCWNCDRVARLPGMINSKSGLLAKVVFDAGPPHDPDLMQEVDATAASAVELDLPKDLPKITDLSAVFTGTPRGLRCQMLASEMRHPDEEPKRNDNSRSAWLFDFMCNALRDGTSPEQVLGIVMDPAWRMSEAVLKNADDTARPNPRRYAEHTLKNALAEIRPPADEAEPGAELVSLAPVPDDLRPRPWLVHGLLMDGQVTLIAGKGGGAKSLLTLHVAAAVAAGQSFLHWEAPTRSSKVLLLNAEDDVDELRRRLLSTCDVMGVDQGILADRVIVLQVPDLVLFTRGEDGLSTTRLHSTLKTLLREHDFGLLIADPLVETHAGLDENSNTDMMFVIKGLREVARRFDIPALVVHHSRKGAGGDQDVARGGSSLVNACRIVKTLEPMSETEAELLPPLDRGERWRFVRVCGAKANYAGRGEDLWMRLESVELPNGDSSPGLVTVDLSGAAEIPEELGSWPRLGELLARVRDGRGDGRPWSPSLTGRKDGRLVPMLEEEFGLSKKAAKDLQRRMLSERVLRIAPYRDGDRNERQGLEVCEGAVAAVPPDQIEVTF